MKKIKKLCSDMRARLDNVKGKGIPIIEIYELLELIVQHLEKPQTVNINIEKLVETINSNCSNLEEEMSKSKKIVVDSLLDALKEITSFDSSIKPQQYRIGNYFKHPVTGVCTVDKIESDNINGFPLNLIQPLLINKTWFENLGFKKKHEDMFEIILGKKGMMYFTGGGDVSLYNDNQITSYRHTYDNIKYVHQLQNIYFDLMQEELKIN